MFTRPISARRKVRALLYAVVVGPALSAYSAAAGNRIAVLPLAADSVADSDAHVLSTVVRTALAGSGWDVVDAFDINRVLRATACDEPAKRGIEACALTVGDSIHADYVLAGVLSRRGPVIEARFRLYAQANRSAAWAKGYRSQGAMTAFLKAVPPKVAAALPAPAAPAQEMVVEEEEAPAYYEKDEAPAQSPSPASARAATPGDDAVARRPVIGVQGIVTLGEAEQTQSVGGGFGYVAYPTTKNSYLRLKLAVPLYHSRQAPLAGEGKLPDPYVSAEQEWGWPNFAIGFGLAYMYLNRFDIDTSEQMSVYDPYYGYGTTQTVDARCHFGPSHAAAVSFNLRGGRPNAGFYGRVAWPLPFLLYDDEPDNLFFEYSAFGVYGRRSIKVGLGAMGMVKAREADYVTANNQRYHYVETRNTDYDYITTAGYSSFEATSINEFFSLMPCLKVAGLVGRHVVITGILDLGGTILPRFAGTDMGVWKPSAGIDLLYSFGELAGPNAMDGTF